jgi:hypothetical protein
MASLHRWTDSANSVDQSSIGSYDDPCDGLVFCVCHLIKNLMPNTLVKGGSILRWMSGLIPTSGSSESTPLRPVARLEMDTSGNGV